MSFYLIEFQFNFLCQKFEHMVKNRLRKHQFFYYLGNLVCIVPGNSAFQIHFMLNQTFVKMVKI